MDEKYRYHVLRGDLAERSRELIRQICAALEVTIMRGAISPDHIHMLVAAPPQLSPSKLVQQECPALRKRYWGQHLWARGRLRGRGRRSHDPRLTVGQGRALRAGRGERCDDRGDSGLGLSECRARCEPRLGDHIVVVTGV